MTRLDYERDRRRRIPGEIIAEAAPPVSRSLEWAARDVRTTRVRRVQAQESIEKARRDLYEAVKLARSEAFQLLFDPQDKKPAAFLLTRATPTLRALRDLPMKMLYGYSNARSSDQDRLVRAAEDLARLYQHWIAQVPR
ncbi:MAG: hypothetical protein ACLGH1_11335 [Gammaproteobacteria bacterium]